MTHNASQHQPADSFKQDLDDFERFALDNLVVNEWGLKAATLNRLMYCGVSVECLEVIEERDLNDIFSDERTIGQKILLRHRLREWRRGLHWNSPEHPPVKRRQERNSLDPLDLDKKPRISTSTGNLHRLPTPNGIVVPDTRNPTSTIASSSTSSSSMHNVTDAGNLPIRITPEALQSFLQTSCSGRWVLNCFSEGQQLDKKALTELTHVVVEPFLMYNIAFTHALMRHYAEVIVQLFPTERMETFYCPRNIIRKNPTGKLYDRYVNQRLRYKTKFNAQRPTMVDEFNQHRTFAEMSTIGDPLMQQQYLEFGMDNSLPRGDYPSTPPQVESFSEESMNVYGTEDVSTL
ncbi:uncharacterized protein LOC131436413 [Malaya genurostris]|uniref:uncharacterized protein LOC131436413 n=1 Tax=Malaya genurostris TaxID=325434 RepID=UPI0026F38020|nr:uncharacterized protein LOC131436413 [Malaya genurostris]XP_058461115.1 uncharacterized protein LOC131436413 [Malaya genurostris]